MMRLIALFGCVLVLLSGCGEPAAVEPGVPSAPVAAGSAPAAGAPAPAAPVAPAPVAAPAAPPARVSPDGYPERWNYVGASLANDKGCEDFIATLRLSRENQVTHILMPEGRWLRFSEDKEYRARVEKIKVVAKELGLTIVPAVVGVGYSGRYFHFDANLAAGIPVKGMLFTVKDGKAAPDASLTVDCTGVDVKDGDASGTLAVKPFHHYTLTFRLKGGDLKKPPQGDEVITGRTSGGKRNNILTNPQFKVEGEGLFGWTTFNSLEGDALKLHITAPGWTISDLKIESAGLLLIVRRDLVPLTVTSEDGKTVYEEGKDFEKIVDPCLKINPYHGETTNNHAPAEFVLTKDSRIKEGDKLKLTYWHTVRIYDDQDCISVEDPRTHAIFEQEFKDCHKVWGASAYFMNYDEIRIGGWEPQPDGRTLKPGQLLAEHFKRNYDMIRKNAPGVTIYTWSDMFTPHHNARAFDVKGYYYLVNGNWDGSWAGVPKDVIIFNWYAPKPESVSFFAELGYKQVLCGFYDAKETEKMKNNIANWKKMSAGQPGMLGFMYTTWSKNYKSLKEYFALVDAAKTVEEAPDSKPEAEPGVPAGH